MNLLSDLKEDFKKILRGNVLLLFITWIMLSFGNNMVHRFDGIYFSALGASNVILGFMGALTFGMMALLQIPGGYIADVFGRRKVIIIFTFVMAFSILIFAFAPSWEYIVVGLIITNVSLLYQPALFSIIMDSLPPEKRAEGFAITNLASLPSLIAPMIGGTLILIYGVITGMRIAYFILFLLSLASAFLRLFLKETIELKKKAKREKFMESFKILKKVNLKAKGLIVGNMLYSSAAGLAGYFIVKYASTYTSPLIFGIAMGIITLLVGTVSIPLGKRADLRGKENFYIAGLFLIGIGFFVFIFPSSLFLFLYASLVGTGQALFAPSNSGLMADFVSEKNRGRFTGVYLFLSYIVAMIFSSLGGYIYSYNHAFLFIISSILMLLASLWGVYIFKK